MTANIYTVKDEMTGTFLNPNIIKTDEEALRIFKYQINNTPIWKDNPEDFSLYKVGNFDDETGTIVGTIPEKLIGGRSVKNAK